MSGKVSPASRAKYEAKVYDKLLLRTRKDTLSAERIKAAAAEAGQSTNAYILQAVEQRMAKEQEQ